MDFKHEAVMLGEVVAAIEAIPHGCFLDATVGGGSHSKGILSARGDLSVLGIDRDNFALKAASQNLSKFSKRVQLINRPFSSVESIFRELEITGISGFLFDLGVSSPQLDHPERGFSYQNDGPLDMRMDPQQEKQASDIINNSAEEDLIKIIRGNSDERFAARISRKIICNRPIGGTLELADLVKSAIPAAKRRTGGHPAKRTFQAIRMEVNREKEELFSTLEFVIEKLVPGGRGVVISYHSGEDRIVKNFFRQALTGGCLCPRLLPCVCGAIKKGKLPYKSLRASDEEIKKNRRAKSAHLRVLERI